MPRFVVDLGNVKLSDAEHTAIAGAIHSAVIGHLAKVSDPAAHHGTKSLTRAGMGFAPPPDSPAPKLPKSTKPAGEPKPAAAKPAQDPADAQAEIPLMPPALCPSVPHDAGVADMRLTGIVGQDGLVANLLTPLPVTPEFLAEVAGQGRPADRFRFAAPCAEGRCENWGEGRCALIGRVLDALAPPAGAALPACGIRPGCRWYRQDGGAACAVCPQVTYNP